jgi:hypothetical protein
MQKTQDLTQAQVERTERAQSAILAGKFQVTRTNPHQWTVKNGDKLPYVVTLRPSQGDSEEVNWACTCMDYQQRGPQILCKHIEGVRLLEAAQPQIHIIQEKESHMNETIPSNDGNLSDRLSRILWNFDSHWICLASNAAKRQVWDPSHIWKDTTLLIEPTVSLDLPGHLT